MRLTRSTIMLMAGVALGALLIFHTRTAAARDDGQAPWSKAQVISIESMVKILDAADKPVLIHVGFEGLYQNSHIPGSVFAGPGMKPEGFDKLKQAVSGLSHDKAIVLYCGCCPFEKCPNVKPAFQTLKDMGFSKVSVLEIPQGFGPDWASKGLPVERTHPASQ